MEVARKHRDQLLRGAELLDKLPAEAGEADYAELQSGMDRIAPDVSNSAWGHKYFSLLFPEKLDDFHSPAWQRFHIIALLQMPPSRPDRYVPAVRFVALARELGISINHLTTILNRRTPLRSHWRIGTSDGTSSRNRWEMMKVGGYIAIGWPKLGDLSGLSYDTASKDTIKSKMSESYPHSAQQVGRETQQVFNFVTVIKPGDLIAACDGATVLGIAKVTGEYVYDASTDFPHHRSVDWYNLDEWKLPRPEGLRSTLHSMKDYPTNAIEMERRMIGAVRIEGGPSRPEREKVSHQTPIRLTGLPGQIQSVLERKGQVILYGPPGTGKSYWALRTARDLAAWTVHGKVFADLTDAQRTDLSGDPNSGLVRMCCFHPGYGYEDFVEGHRPESIAGRMHFTLRDGLFKRTCADASTNPDKHYFLIIDEINRGDIPRILGELLHALELDKRGEALVLPLSGQVMRIPRNLYLIGTMNTADRSISLLDTALRRRFGFIELMPDTSLLSNIVIEGIPLGAWLASLNTRVCEHIGRDARNLQVGHAYFLDGNGPVTTFAKLSRILREDVIPLLQEYCYEDYAALERILGTGLVDAKTQCIQHSLFEEANQADLIQALLAPCPEVATSAQATSRDTAPESDENEDEGDTDEQSNGKT